MSRIISLEKVIVSVLGLYILSFSILEIDKFFGLFFTFANYSIQFISFIFFFLFFVVLMRTRFKIILPNKYFFLIFLSYLFYIFSEVLSAMLSSSGERELAFIAYYTVLILFTIILLNSYYYVISLKNKSDNKYFIKAYISLCLYISVAGFIAWLLIVTQIVSFENWYLPDGLQKKDISALNENRSAPIYSMPFGLGMVMVGQGGIGIENLAMFFPRATGLAREPHLIAFFISPALFLVHYVSKNNKKILLYRSIFILFLCVVFSATTILIFSFFGTLFLIRNIIIKKTTASIMLTRIIGLLFLLTLGLTFIINYTNIPGKILRVQDSNIYLSIFGDISNLQIIGKPIFIKNSRSIISFVFQIIHIATFSFILFKYFFSKSNKYFYMLGPIYLFFHSFKVYGHLSFDPMYIFSFFLSSIIIMDIRKELYIHKVVKKMPKYIKFS